IIFSFEFKYPLGLTLGIASGFTMAIFSVFNSRFITRIHHYTITFYEMIGAFICTVLFLPFYQALWANNHQLHLAPIGMDWIYIGILSFICTTYAYSAGIELLKRLSVFFVQLTLNLEPLYGIIMALIIFGDSEKMEFEFYVGTAIIIGSVISYPFFKEKFIRNHKVPDQ
ncbi:MAG TPA: DMT family transporter, partial [Cyclobacteriaceae bacterium]